MPVLFPVHPRTRERLASGPLPGLLREAGVRLVPPLGYAAMARALCRARLVLTDSGGVQDECAILGVPCITVRTTTERPATVSSGSNRVVGTSPDAIHRAVHAALKNPGRTPPPPLWDGHAGERIAAVLLDA
jgi:UDP-N-acetylglucosamine 2-epimerase (non-hydrolysing)